MQGRHDLLRGAANGGPLTGREGGAGGEAHSFNSQALNLVGMYKMHRGMASTKRLAVGPTFLMSVRRNQSREGN